MKIVAKDLGSFYNKENLFKLRTASVKRPKEN